MFHTEVNFRLRQAAEVTWFSGPPQRACRHSAWSKGNRPATTPSRLSFQACHCRRPRISSSSSPTRLLAPRRAPSPVYHCACPSEDCVSCSLEEWSPGGWACGAHLFSHFGGRGLEPGPLAHVAVPSILQVKEGPEFLCFQLVVLGERHEARGRPEQVRPKCSCALSG